MTSTVNDQSQERTERRTMPPPELLDRSAPASAGSLVLDALRAEEPITRHRGPRAEVAYLRARVVQCHDDGDKAGEREAAIELARLLVSRDTEIDTAIEMAERALQIGEDADLREDLADWYAGIGEPATAAAVLRVSCDPSNPIATAQVLEQIAVLLARSGDPGAAAAALEQAATLDPSQPLAFELLGAISAWAVKAVPSDVAAHAYLAAAERHDSLGDAESSVEDRLRAFELATQDETVAEAAFQALAIRGALDAADEALREHANAVGETNRYRARQVHLRRVTTALDEDHAARALGALLDAGVIGETDTDLGAIADRVLELSRLDALVAVRRKLQSKVGSIGAIVSQARGVEAAAATLLQATLHASNNRERADSLVQLAASTSGEVAAVLLAVAAESYLGLGLNQHARRTAEDACLADPASARAFSALARATIAAPERDAAMAVESGSSTMLIRASICSGMAHAFEAVGEDAQALTWTQRWLALQPGSPEAMHELVRRASKAYDPDRLEEALHWVLSQPRPLDDMASAFGEALELLAELDQDRANDLGRRALDMYGPRVPGLRGRLLALGDRTGDASLSINLLERLVSSKVKDGRAVERLFDLAQRRSAAADWDGAAAELARAAARSAPSRTLNEHLDVLDGKMQAAQASLGSDGLVSFVEARVYTLGALVDGPEQSQLENLALAWRELGSVKWDLAYDAQGAEQAFFQAAQAAPQGGMVRYAHDLMTFAGPEPGLDAVIRRAARLDEPKRHAALLIEAANLAYAHKLSKRAMEIAASAIQIDPSRADAVAIVEKASDGASGIETLDRIYKVLAGAALGCYGRRAAHYRGARQLERRGSAIAAMRHAVAAFEAVPSEGTAYVLMARLSERSGDPSEAIAAIQRVADAAQPGARATWLLRAASMAGTGEEAARVRCNLLLRAITARPDASTIDQVGVVIRQLLTHGDDADILSMRFERAAVASLKKADGPDAARAAISLARVAFDALTAYKLGLALLQKAVAANGDIDEYVSIVESASSVTTAEPGAVKEFVEALIGIATQPYSSMGSALLRLGSRFADKLGDVRNTAVLLVQAVRRAPEDDQLVCEADAAVRAARDAELTKDLDKAIAPNERVAALTRIAEAKERTGAWAEAIDILDRALESHIMEPVQREAVVSSMRRLLSLSGNAADVEALLRKEVARTEFDPAVRVRMALDLASLLGNRGDDAAALETLKSVSRLVDKDKDLMVATLRLARRTGDKPLQLSLLAHLVDMTPGDAARKTVEREMARLHEQLGDVSSAQAPTKPGLADPAPQSTAAVTKRAAATNVPVSNVTATKRGTGEIEPAKPAAPSKKPSGTTPATNAPATNAQPASAAAPKTVAPFTAKSSVIEPAPSLEQQQAQAIERGDHATVAAILAKRIQESPEPLRKLTLRKNRANVLEHQLNRFEEARDELLTLFAETPGDTEAMQSLALLHERLGKPLLAANLWKQVRESSSAKNTRLDAAVHAIRAYLAGHDAKAAQAMLESVASVVPRETVIELRAAIARELGDVRGQSDALEQLGNAASQSPEKRAAHFLEAAHLASANGDDPLALERARRAVQLAPHSAEAVLELRRLEYRIRGTGTPREAQFAIEELTRIAGDLSRDQLELQVFLLAEELDVVQGRGAGMRELNKRHAELGNAPLIALGMAERLVRNKNFDAAIQLFERAVQGNLRGVRTKGRVALSAAQAAMSAGQLEVAARMLDIAAAETDTRPMALRRQLEFVAKHGEPDAARHALDELIRQSTGIDKARFLVQLGRLLAATDPGDAIRFFSEAIPLATSDRALTGQIDDELARLRPKTPAKEAPAVDVEWEEEDDFDDIPIPLATAAIRTKPAAIAVTPPAVKPIEKRAEPPTISPTLEPSADVFSSVATSANSSGASGGEPADETSLFAQLAAGSYEAGDRLVTLYSVDSTDRSRDVLAVRKQQASIRPGDRLGLENLRLAAIADHNETYARAIEHIIRGFDSLQTPLAPPPLSALMTSSELVLALLFRPLETPLDEALALTWESGRYRREPTHYGLSGAIRVQPGAATSLGEAYGSVIRIFGATRTPLFHRRLAPTQGGVGAPLAMQIALLMPPAMLMVGDVLRDTAELHYLLGTGIAGTTTEYVLARGLPEENLRTLVAALQAAFGPVNASAKTDPAVARLGQDLWQLVNPRADRRLREIFASDTATSYELPLYASRRAARRAGLFACGDLPTALRLVVAELGISLDVPLTATDGLALACQKHSEIAELVRLATRSEYAEARWNASSAMDPRKGRASQSIRPT
jgi:tetratricopeptide (TPR) repeat protein